MSVASHSRRVVALLVLLFLIAASGFSWWYARAVGRRPRPEFRVAVADTARARTGADDIGVGITRDGSTIVYGAENVDAAGVRHETLVLRRVASGAAAPLLTAPAGAEARSPFFSYDGTAVGFIDRGRLMRVSVDGGAAQELCACAASPGVRAVWLQDGSIVYQANHRLRLLGPGGVRRDLTRLDAAAGEREHIAPTVLGDQQTILFTALGAGDTTVVRSVHLVTGKEALVLPGGMAAQYAGDGHVAYADASYMLRVIDLDPVTLRVNGVVPVAPVRITADPRGSAGWAVSEVGTVVHAPGASGPDGTPAVRGRRELSWIARDGRRQPSGLPPGGYVMARIAPDGDAVALEVRDQTVNVWMWDLPTNRLSPLTTGPRNAFPEWLPDGQGLLISSGIGRVPTLTRVSRDGTKPVIEVPAQVPVEGALSISAHGSLAAFRSEWPGTHLRAMSATGSVVTTVVTNGQGREQAASLSPRGTWLAWDATPRDAVPSRENVSEVFVQPFPESTVGQRISLGAGSRPLWSRDGREIFYLDSRKRMRRVEVTASEPPQFGIPTPFFEDATATDDWFVDLGRRTFDLTPDGSRFLAITSGAGPPPQSRDALVISVGWLRHIHWPWVRLCRYLNVC